MDGSAREWQRAGSQWTAGKNFDATMPIGPEIVTTDELDATDVQLTTTLNGEVMQSASTAQMIFDIPRCIEFVSSFTTLHPGDVIATGTPGGVGFARTPPVWLTPGDLLEVSVEGVGRIANRVVEEGGDHADWPWDPAGQGQSHALTRPDSMRRGDHGRRDRNTSSAGYWCRRWSPPCCSRPPAASSSRRQLIELVGGRRRVRSGSESGSASGSNLTVADVAPFTGTDAALGPTYLVSCDAATSAINSAGGVMGHRLAASRSTPAATRPTPCPPSIRCMPRGRPALVIGCTSDEAASVVPIFGANKTVSFCMTGQSEFDHVKFPYFYRLVPPDLSESYAMVAIAQKKGYKRVALAFGNDIGSQTFVAPAIAALKKAGMTMVANQTLDLNATTFRTEAAAIVNAHPDAIMTEALGPTEASFMSEVKQLNGGKPIPVIGTSATISPDWYKSVAAAVGASTLASSFVADNLVTETSGPAFQAFSKAITPRRARSAAPATSPPT